MLYRASAGQRFSDGKLRIGVHGLVWVTLARLVQVQSPPAIRWSRRLASMSASSRSGGARVPVQRPLAELM